MNMDTILSVITGAEVIGLVSLMTANLVLAVIAAIKSKTFSFGNLGDFVGKRMSPMITYFVVAFMANIDPQWTAAAIAVYAGLVSLYGHGVVSAIKSLTGINIPWPLSEKNR